MLALLLAAAAPPHVLFIASPPDAKPKPGEHEYRLGCETLAEAVRGRGLTAEVHTGWPADLGKPAAVVLFVLGGDTNPAAKDDRLKQLERLADAGTGLVFLHSAIDFDAKHADAVKRLAGGVWQKAGGKRAHWVAEFNDFPKHPVFDGVTAFKLDDGWLWNNVRDKATVPLLKTVGPKDDGKTTADGSVVSWAFERPAGGRAFVFTGGHLHASLKLDGYKRFLTNGVVWAAKP